MSQENIGNKSYILMEYERIIRELTNENETLKRRVSELEEENRIFKGARGPTREIPKPEFQYGIKTPTIEQDVVFSSSAFSQDRVPLEMGKGPIVEGISRRECPICGNTSKALIHEIIDKTHIISAYPKMYGKKYKCGSCGREWRLPVEI
ncbi:MAG: hypothetical protein ACFFCL_02325 [Promethearchaeota archaeon]